MIRHIVMFKIKDEFKDEIPQLVENFYGMKGKIEGLVSLEAGADFL
ncbi:MAG: Dabb family protein, partial [Oscillospiraceae bacterium]|nr:Dabb family protein [Oscillospiraceae bacterium]